MTIAGFLLDENVNPLLAAAIHRSRPDISVRRVGEGMAPRLGTLDPMILEWCEAEHFALVTYNRSTMPAHLREHLGRGRHVPGIFILKRHLTFGQIRDELVLI